MISQDKEALLALLTQNSGRVRSLGVKRLGLFGSYVRGDQSDESDVDLLVEFEKDKKSFDNFMALAFFLEDLLHRPVELVTPEAVSPCIRPHIMSEVEYVALVA